MITVTDRKWCRYWRWRWDRDDIELLPSLRLLRSGSCDDHTLFRLDGKSATGWRLIFSWFALGITVGRTTWRTEDMESIKARL